MKMRVKKEKEKKKETKLEANKVKKLRTRVARKVEKT